jgi:hypothetical protein
MEKKSKGIEEGECKHQSKAISTKAVAENNPQETTYQSSD